MVRINSSELARKIQLSQQGRRMPMLCALTRSQASRIMSEGLTETSKGLRTNSFDLSNEKYLTSIAVADNEVGLIAMGSAYQRKDRTYCLYIVKDLVAPTNVSVGSARFELLHTEKLDIPIHSLDWSGTHLLLGSKHGITRLYTIHRQDDTEESVKVTQVAEFVMPVERVYNSPVVPEECPMNSIIKTVQFNSMYSDDAVYQQWQPLAPFSQDELHKEEREVQEANYTEFLSTFMSQVNVWDALQEERPKYMFNMDSGLLNCASWSPHEPHTLIVTGGYDRALKIIDVRSNGVVWQAEEAHTRPIRDAKFNTFIPYWVASGGDGGTVNIFDIRASYHAPVAKISGHDGSIESLSWSNVRCENLATTSSDGTMRYWTINQKAIPVMDAFYETTKWSKIDTPAATIRPPSKCKRYTWLDSQVQEPWSKVDQHIYYGDTDDPWGNSEDYDPETMTMPSAFGIGQWGRSYTGPVYIGEDYDKSKGSVVKVSASKWLLADYYCITAHGQLCVQSIRIENKELMSHSYKFNKQKYPLANQIEYELYTRHIDQARDNLEQLKSINDDDSARMEQVEFFEECLQTPPPISADTWEIDSLPDKKDRRISRRLWNDDDLWDFAITTFSKDIGFWGECRLPPGYATRYKFPLNVKERSMIVPPIVKSVSPPVSEESISRSQTAISTSTKSVTPTRSITPKKSQTSAKSYSTRSSTLSKLSRRMSGVSLPSYDPRSSLANTTASRTDTLQSAVPTNASQSTAASITGVPHSQNRFIRPAKSLKRIFSTRRGKSKDQSSSSSIKQTEQEGVIDEAPPEPQLTRKRTSRRNALFGAS